MLAQSDPPGVYVTGARPSGMVTLQAYFWHYLGGNARCKGWCRDRAAVPSGGSAFSEKGDPMLKVVVIWVIANTMSKKTQEEIREGNRVRQKRWRDRHKWLARERKLACYGKAAWQLASVSNNVKGGMYDSEGLSDSVVGGEQGDEAAVAADDRSGALAGEARVRDGEVGDREAALEAQVEARGGAGSGSAVVSEEEVRVAERLAKLVARRKVSNNDLTVLEPPAEDSRTGVEVEGF